MIILREYIKNLLIEMIGKEPDYKIKEIALNWYAKSELTLEDLDEITTLIDKNKEPMEEVIEEVIDEIVETPTIEEPTEVVLEEPLILE